MNAPEKIPTSQGNLSDEEIISALTYVSYASNRDQGMSANRLSKLFPRSGAAMEERYRAEKTQPNLLPPFPEQRRKSWLDDDPDYPRQDQEAREACHDGKVPE